MTTFLVQNNTWPAETNARMAWPSKAAVRRGQWWNIWKTRQAPFNVFSEGTLVLLLDSWPGGGVLSWLTRAREVHTDVLPNKDAAVQAIARWAGQSPRWVLRDPYTARRPADAGVVIFWRADPIVRLGVARPPQLVLRRNGWLVTDDGSLKSWGIKLSTNRVHAGHGQNAPAGGSAATGRRGHGRRLDVQTKDAIEARAMVVAMAWCRRNGWSSVRDVSGHMSWDLEAVDELGVNRYIEVKGTTGGPESVEVTKGEVDAASRHGPAHSLVVVYDIVVTVNAGRPTAKGGAVAPYDPWCPRKSELVAQRFTWQPSKSRTLGI